MSRNCVIAGAKLPIGAKTKSFSPETFGLRVDLEKVNFPLHANISKKNELQLQTGTFPSWFRFIKFAPDCYEENIRVSKCSGDSSKIILETVKEIQPNNELFLWFSLDLITDLGIPLYLNPSNIRGEKTYVCHKCTKVFETPNILKLHLALACGSLTIEHLWQRLAQTLAVQVGPMVPILVRTPSFRIPPIVIPVPPTTTSSTVTSSTTPSILHSQQTHFETLLSNIGKSKNGTHVCLYCGKLYSRKYGLKIHIRTHTGFKPLKCKVCQRPFGDPSNLNKHVRLHSDGNTPYRCEFCGKVLVRRRDLDRHIQSRHPNLRLTIPSSIP